MSYNIKSISIEDAITEIKRLQAINAELMEACRLVSQSAMRNAAYDACCEALRSCGYEIA